MHDNLIPKVEMYVKLYVQINERYIRSYARQLVFSLLRNMSFLASYLTTESELHKLMCLRLCPFRFKGLGKSEFYFVCGVGAHWTLRRNILRIKPCPSTPNATSFEDRDVKRRTKKVV
jgi:hypothetical protein